MISAKIRSMIYLRDDSFTFGSRSIVLFQLKIEFQKKAFLSFHDVIAPQKMFMLHVNCIRLTGEAHFKTYKKPKQMSI